MRVYYDPETNEILFIEEFRLGPDGDDDPSPGDYIDAPNVNLNNYDEKDWRIIDGQFVKKPQAEIDARISEEQADREAQIAIEEAHHAVTQELARACDGFAFLFEKYVPNMTEGEKSAIKVFRDKYAAWVALNGEE